MARLEAFGSEPVGQGEIKTLRIIKIGLENHGSLSHNFLRQLLPMRGARR